MPVYEYKCLKCQKKFEIMQKFSDKPLEICPDCKGRIKKLISNTSFILKGTGWYATDYASTDRKKAVDAEKNANGGKTADSIEQPKSEAKTESPVKAEPKVKSAGS